MPRLLPLTGLRAFEAAARHLSFGAAAVELGVTPTAISHQVAALERTCGVPLFRRRPRPLALTVSGEALFPAVRDAMHSLADAVARLRPDAQARLRVTTTNAFAARWLLPRLPDWRAMHPTLGLDILGTDALFDLRAGDADLAVRYGREAPAQLCAIELARDRFHAMASPALLGRKRVPLAPSAIASLPRLDCDWPATDEEAPTWARWAMVAGVALRSPAGLGFREEAHAIEAAVAGQGVALLSDVLVAREVAAGALVIVSPISLPGYSFWLAWREDHPRRVAVTTFRSWIERQLPPGCGGLGI